MQRNVDRKRRNEMIHFPEAVENNQTEGGEDVKTAPFFS